MNVPNLLTTIRFILIPVYVAIFASGHVMWAFAVVLAAGLTDILDGHIARTRGLVTRAGEMLDPLADKLMMIAVIISLMVAGYIPWYAALPVFIRDAGMIVGSAVFHFRGKRTVPANAMGKLTTVLYYLAVLFIVFRFDFAIAYLWFVIAFSFLTSGIYIIKFQKLNREHPAGGENVKSGA
ncbi:MAG: CDP-diacylglycerol--glycerol-3-phosphate 3-phosphatidyltransferase [Paenibacillaceae bacterium ZCTH02-B3]|nr:MAG: CDP-diacylglycerol--glycerol-3-phosphate 3-phosphatidyltransferase [Paenibacillaceae bacterium ZCTH02-B3]